MARTGSMREYEDLVSTYFRLTQRALVGYDPRTALAFAKQCLASLYFMP